MNHSRKPDAIAQLVLRPLRKEMTSCSNSYIQHILLWRFSNENISVAIVEVEMVLLNQGHQALVSIGHCLKEACPGTERLGYWSQPKCSEMECRAVNIRMLHS